MSCQNAKYLAISIKQLSETERILFQESGQRIACQLVTHGANLEYQDIALRNTLFWAVYNNNRCNSNNNNNEQEQEQ